MENGLAFWNGQDISNACENEDLNTIFSNPSIWFTRFPIGVWNSCPGGFPNPGSFVVSVAQANVCFNSLNTLDSVWIKNVQISRPTISSMSTN